MDEREHPAGPERAQPAEPAQPAAASEPEPSPRRRGAAARRALASRGAGWVVATGLAGAVVALSVVLATEPSNTVILPAGAFGPAARVIPGQHSAEVPPWLRIQMPARPAQRLIPGCRIPVGTLVPGSMQLPIPGGLQFRVPGGLQFRVPAGLRIALPAGQGQVRVGPRGAWVQVPAAPGQVRVVGPVCYGPAGVLIPAG